MTKHLQGPAFVPDRTSGGLHLAAGSPVHQYHPKVQSQKPACLSLSPLAQALLPARTPTQAVRSAVAMVTSKATPRHPGCIHAKELLQRFLLHLTPIAGQRRRAGVGKRGRHISRAQQNQPPLFPPRRSCRPPALRRRSWVTQQGWLVYTGFESSQLLHTKWSRPPPSSEPTSRASAQKPPARLGLKPPSISAFPQENGSCSGPATPKTQSSVKEGTHQCCEGK